MAKFYNIPSIRNPIAKYILICFNLLLYLTGQGYQPHTLILTLPFSLLACEEAFSEN